MNELKRIILSQGRFAIVDNEDFSYLSQFKWCLSNTGYAVRMKNKKLIMMHRLVMKTPSNLVVDHLNRDKLDNRKVNLRNCTQSKNIHNSFLKKIKTRGIHWREDLKKWRVIIHKNYKQIHLGVFKSLDEAIIARKKADKLYYAK